MRGWGKSERGAGRPRGAKCHCVPFVRQPGLPPRVQRLSALPGRGATPPPPQQDGDQISLRTASPHHKKRCTLSAPRRSPLGGGQYKKAGAVGRGGGSWGRFRSLPGGAPAPAAPGTCLCGPSCVPSRRPTRPSPLPTPQARSYSGSAGALGGLGAAGEPAWSGGSWGGGWRGLRPLGRGGLRA